MVGALEHVAEHLAVDQGVALVGASVVEGVQLAANAEDDDLPIPGRDHSSVAAEDLRREAEPGVCASRMTSPTRPRLSRPVPLFLREADVEELLSPAEAVEVVEACFGRIARGAVENRPRSRLGLEDGLLNVMAATDLELRRAGVKTYAGFAEGARFVVALFAADGPELLALLEADQLGRLRTGAASAVAARHLARSAARTLGLIGTGRQAETQLACLRVVLPELERVVAYSRDEERLEAFCGAI